MAHKIARSIIGVIQARERVVRMCSGTSKLCGAGLSLRKESADSVYRSE